MSIGKENFVPVFISIPSSSMGGFHKMLSRINKKATTAGLGSVEYILESIETVKKTVQGPHGARDVFSEVYNLCVYSPIPRIEGWSLVAMMKRDGEDHPIIHYVKENPSDRIVNFVKDRTTRTCDHCHTNRIRNTCFVLQHEQHGTLMQVGSTCVHDFLGSTDPKIFEKYFGLNDEITAFGMIDHSREYGIDWSSRVLDIIAESLAHAEYAGRFVSSSLANSHYELAEANMTYNPKYLESTRNAVTDSLVCMKRPVLAQQKHLDEANKVIEWAKEFVNHKDYDPSISWMFNTIRIASQKTITQEIGICASIIVLYKKYNEQVVENTSNHVGEVKERREFTLTLVRHSIGSNEWGNTYMYFCTDADGNNINIKMTKSLGAWNVNEIKTMIGTVKNHSDHIKFGKATWINRVKLVD